MDEFIRKKILYYLKYKYDKDPHHPVDLLEHFETEVSVIERNILYLSQKYLVEHHDTQGHKHALARITAEGIKFVEEDLTCNYELNILEFMRENLENRKLKFHDFPEYLFPDRKKLNANLLKYDKSEVAIIRASGSPKQVRLVFPQDTLIKRLEKLKIEKEYKPSPVMNIAHIHYMESSQFQQGTIDSIQKGTFEIGNQKQLSEFIELLKTKLPELEISVDDKSVIEADVATIEAQMKSNRPKTGIIKEGLLSIKRILEGATGAVIATGLLKCLSMFFGA